MVRTREQLLQAFCAAPTLEAMTKVAADCMDTLQAVESTEAFARAENKRLKEQIARQAKVIEGLERALKG